jgi:DNA-binding transcriptional LysR family regulator
MILIVASEILMDIFPWYATELFLQVCEAGGLSAASRFGKIGITQPALSAQMMALEQHLGKKIFHRKPFELTAEGVIFREEALRIRARMSQIRDSLADETERPLRIASSDVVIRDHLPGLLKQMDAATRTRLILQEAQSQDLAGLVRDGDVDLAIGLLSRHVPSTASPLVEKIGELPILLLVPPKYEGTVKSWEDFVQLQRQGGKLGLVSLSQSNLVMRHITTSLRRVGIEWLPTLEVSSIGHVPAYVDLDFGFGFGFAIHNAEANKNNPFILQPPLEALPPLNLVVWHGESLSPSAARLLNLIRRYTGRLLPSV